MALIELKRGIDPGTYPFKIVNVEDKQGPSGYPYLILSMICQGKGNKGLNHSERLSLSPQARFRVNQFLDSIGAAAKGRVNSTSFIGKTAWAMMDMQDDNQGGRRIGVARWILPPEDAEEYFAGADDKDESVNEPADELEQVVANAIDELNGATDDDIPF